MITLFALNNALAPNPIKVGCLLEELNLDYQVQPKEFFEGVENSVKSSDFEAINPNGRVPAIIDNGTKVWESGNILQYLSEKYDNTGILYGKTLEERTEVDNWLFLQVTTFGPFMGQLIYFKHYFNCFWGEDVQPTVIKRFEKECYRILDILEKQLQRQENKGSDFLVTKHYTIADIAFLGWMRMHETAEYDFTSYPLTFAWFNRLNERPSTKKAFEKLSITSA